MIQKDWLSGNPSAGASTDAYASTAGHLSITYADDTTNAADVKQLAGIMLALGYLLLGPTILLIGYHLLWAATTFRQVQTMEMLSRLILSVAAVSVSFEVCTTLIGLSNTFNQAVIQLHTTIRYHTTHLGDSDIAYVLTGESDLSSFRGIVIPISRWGCTMNDFVKLLAEKFATDAAQFIPFVGGFAHLALGIVDAIQVAKHIGEFVTLILSITLCTQVFVRIIFINYYILMAPVVFACWALPDGTGSKLFQQWMKGFLTVLFMQGIQLFILTTLPLITPTFPPLPTDRFGLVNIFFEQLPRIIVLSAVVKVPQMMGSQATRAIAQAGTVAGGAVAAAGAAAYQAV